MSDAQAAPDRLRPRAGLAREPGHRALAENQGTTTAVEISVDVVRQD